MPKRRMWVIKLGGSLAFSPELTVWLECLAGSIGETRIVVVPGGGPYADQVRRLQQHWRFDDESAHYLAVLAMEQYAQLLRVLAPSLVPACGVDEIRAVLSKGDVALWLPARAASAAELPNSWDVTSDSLSLWLAGQLDAEHLFLVKSSAPPGNERDSAALASAGFVDRHFPSLLRRALCTVSWFSKEEHEEFARMTNEASADVSWTDPERASRVITP